MHWEKVLRLLIAGQGTFLGNNLGNINVVISWRGVAHYGAPSEGEPGFSGESPALIMPGSRVRVPPLLSLEASHSLELRGFLHQARHPGVVARGGVSAPIM